MKPTALKPGIIFLLIVVPVMMLITGGEMFPGLGILDQLLVIGLLYFAGRMIGRVIRLVVFRKKPRAGQKTNPSAEKDGGFESES